MLQDPSSEDHSAEKKAVLNEEQQQAVREILEEWDSQAPRPCLIKGVTGSGKTEVYMELIRHVLEQGRQVILLIPEIALTYQNVSRFYARFGEQVSLIHSRMSQENGTISLNGRKRERSPL